MTTKTLFLTALVIAVTTISSLDSHAQQTKIRELERKIESLENLTATLLQRIEALESAANGEPAQNPERIVSKGDWRELSNWRRLEVGMSMDDVRNLLGEPEKVNVGPGLIFWYWQYPGGPSVHFDANSKKADGWSEP